MELVQCIRNVYEEDPLTGSENERILFKKGYFYPAYQDDDEHWITVDDEGEHHIIASGESPAEDFWFLYRFRIA